MEIDLIRTIRQRTRSIMDQIDSAASHVGLQQSQATLSQSTARFRNVPFLSKQISSETPPVSILSRRSRISD